MTAPTPINTRDRMSRRSVLGTAALGAFALGQNPALAKKPDNEKNQPNQAPAARIDGTGQGWVTLGEDDFAHVNSADDTWRWGDDGILYCTGKPVSVLRSAKLYTNLEVSFEWNHRKPAGNSGMFVWADQKKIQAMTKAGKPGLPTGIEVQILDTAYADAMKQRNPKADTSWFTSHGDVFPVGQKMKPFPPLSPNGTRSFPSEDRVKPSGNWNHYYVRAINGEIRLWVNGKEVSGGNQCSTTTGYLCLESEGSPIEFRNLRLRELP
jgi:hypothetical protein